MKKINVTRTKLPELDDYIKYLKVIWKNNWITNNGEFCIELEEKLSEYLEVDNLVLVSNGTIAIQMALRAMNLKGEVITTPFTFPATTNAIIWEGLNPVFCDIDPEIFNIDVKKIEEKITKRTSAILAVHVYGNPCEVDRLEKIARKYKIKVIYDAAHAFGVKYKDKSILNWGDASTLSFHATKIFHSVEGGGIISGTMALDKVLRTIRNHGIEEYKFKGPTMVGTNAKMSELHAAMGLCNLKKVGKSFMARERRYKLYKELIGDDGVKYQKLNPNMTEYNFSYIPVVFENEKVRDKVYKNLSKKNIFARKYFYPAIHELDYIKSVNKNLKVAEKIARGVLCLPLYDDLGLDTVELISKIIKESI